MTTWQERMAEMVSPARMRPLMEALAAGGPVDEGERITDWEGVHPIMNRLAEDRPARVEWDADARLWLIENPDESVPAEWSAPLRKAVRAARSKNDHVALQRIAQSFENPEWRPVARDVADVPDYGPSGDASDLAAVDFYTEVEAGAEQLVLQGWPRHAYPAQEYMRRKAEEKSGWRRVYASQGGERSEKEAEYLRLFKQYDRRYRYQAKRHRAQRRKQRETTKGLPV